MRLTDYLLASVERHPEKIMLLHAAKRFTYREIFCAAQAIASRLHAFHLERGFRAGLLHDDPFAYIVSYFGVLLAGGVVVGLNTQTSESGLAYLLNDCQVSVLLGSAKFSRYLRAALPLVPSLRVVALSAVQQQEAAELATSVVALDFNDLLAWPHLPPSSLPYRSSCDYAQIIYTSGTTGKPKGVVLRHANLVANTESIVSYLRLQAADRAMAVLPFFYSYGNSVLLTHVAVGGSLVANQSFVYPNVVLQQMVEHAVTGISGVPSTFALLLNRSALAAYAFPALRYLTQAGASMSPELVRRLKTAFPGVELYIMYGQTEASARLAYLHPDEVERRPGSIGKAIPGVELTLRDAKGQLVGVGETGEIVARGDNLMVGYWNCPEATNKVLRPEGLWTGDLARSDEEGFLYIVSRKSDLIKSGAHRIGPKEIEDVLAEHPAVHEAAVIGLPDALLDERICACVVLRQGAVGDEKLLKVHCKKHLPQYKIPHDVIFLDDLPKTTSGKIAKNELRSRIIGS